MQHPTIKTVGDLLEAAKSDPSLLWRAHRKIRRVIFAPKNGGELEPLHELKNPTVEEIRLYHDQPSQRKRYPIFADELFCIEPELAEVAEFFNEAFTGGVSECRLLQIKGVSGSGKTTLSRVICDNMRKEMFFALAGCTHKEHPLHAVPPEEREKIFQDHYYFEGEPCKKCEERLQSDELKNIWQEFPVELHMYRRSSGVGLQHVEDPLPEPGGGRIPEAWHKVLDMSNGGALFVDLDKQPEKFRSIIATLVTDGVLKADDQTEWYPDFAVINISNKDFLDLVSDSDRKDALKTRIVNVTFHAVTDPYAELRIQRKMVKYVKSEKHFVPHTELALAHLVTASRLSDSTDISNKPEELLRFYAGKALSEISYQELRRRRPDDGMNGIDTRDSAQILAYARQWNDCVGIQHIMSVLKAMNPDKKYSFAIAKRVKELLDESNGISFMEGVYLELLRNDLICGWSGQNTFESHKIKMLERYISHISAYITKGKIYENGEDVPPNEGFMKGLEEQIKIIGSAADEFRRKVNALFPKPPYQLSTHPLLDQAISQKAAFESLEAIKLAITDKAVDPNETRKKLSRMKNEMIQNMGYKECCLENILGYARLTLFKN